jgi:hypothetical protein
MRNIQEGEAFGTLSVLNESDSRALRTYSRLRR